MLRIWLTRLQSHKKGVTEWNTGVERKKQLECGSSIGTTLTELGARGACFQQQIQLHNLMRLGGCDTKYTQTDERTHNGGWHKERFFDAVPSRLAPLGLAKKIFASVFHLSAKCHKSKL
jgi:hypothetical protein